MTASESTADSRRVIYDFGSNNGDDIPYYLLKGDRVVAVEANPALADEIRRKFPEEIKAGRVVVENCVLTAGTAAQSVPFFVHKTKHFLSQFPRPAPGDIDQFTEIRLPSRSIGDIVAGHGAPYYVKVDLEHYDAVVLDALFRLDIRPPFISSEAHSVDIFCLLVASGRYRAFKLVDGQSVAQRFREHAVKGINGDVRYSFPAHSAGPFGEDIPGPWLTANHMFKLLAFAGTGWKDIHATTTAEPDPHFVPKLDIRMAWNLAQRLALRKLRSVRGGS